ncbi:hypothetical protein [Spirosoma foliorum]|uniref:Uncharacterized protein n=1 Tax=Spirosoma foliorum TaxID=2710596 RepID=A0A7G5GWC5_9BACT|nr:hypothetical protein [Spirosoma foliorum]QMW03167.1 hypothetical protein H3H32_35760 [Spirosoma foliorum]
MQIFFNTINLPFKVGDTVFVNKEHGSHLPDKTGPIYPYFEAEIARIFFDGRLEELSVIAEPLDSYELEVKNVIYELKPVGNYSDLVRMPLRMTLPIKEPILFPSEQELLDYQQTLDSVVNLQTLKTDLKEDKPA